MRTLVLVCGNVFDGLSAASGAPRAPEITTLDHYPLNVNDAEATRRVHDAFLRHFPAERVRQTGPAPASD